MTTIETTTDRAAELMALQQFQEMLANEGDGTQRFLVMADLCRDNDAERDCPELILACRAMHEDVKVGPKVYRAGWSQHRQAYWVHGKVTGRRLRNRLTGFEHVGANFADLVHEFKNILGAEAAKAAKRKSKSDEAKRLAAEWVNPYKVGDLLSNSWGYEQTNWDFCQVVAVGPKSVTVRMVAKRIIRSTGHMSAYVVPICDGFTAEAKVVRFTFAVYQGKLHPRLPARYGSWSAVGNREEFLETYYA
jgi:hypothetical protein